MRIVEDDIIGDNEDDLAVVLEAIVMEVVVGVAALDEDVVV